MRRSVSVAFRTLFSSTSSPRAIMRSETAARSIRSAIAVASPRSQPRAGQRVASRSSSWREMRQNANGASPMRSASADLVGPQFVGDDDRDRLLDVGVRASVLDGGAEGVPRRRLGGGGGDLDSGDNGRAARVADEDAGALLVAALGLDAVDAVAPARVQPAQRVGELGADGDGERGRGDGGLGGGQRRGEPAEALAEAPVGRLVVERPAHTGGDVGDGEARLLVEAEAHEAQSSEQRLAADAAARPVLAAQRTRPALAPHPLPDLHLAAGVGEHDGVLERQVGRAFDLPPHGVRRDGAGRSRRAFVDREPRLPRDGAGVRSHRRRRRRARVRRGSGDSIRGARRAAFRGRPLRAARA